MIRYDCYRVCYYYYDIRYIYIMFGLAGTFCSFSSVLKHANSFYQPRQRCGKFEDENGVELLKGQMRLGLDVFLPDGKGYSAWKLQRFSRSTYYLYQKSLKSVCWYCIYVWSTVSFIFMNISHFSRGSAAKHWRVAVANDLHVWILAKSKSIDGPCSLTINIQRDLSSVSNQSCQTHLQGIRTQNFLQSK